MTKKERQLEQELNAARDLCARQLAKIKRQAARIRTLERQQGNEHEQSNNS